MSWCRLENLRTHPSVAAGIARGDLKLHGWVYKIQTGEVFAYDPVQAQFLPLVPSASSPRASPPRGELLKGRSQESGIRNQESGVRDQESGISLTPDS